MACFACQKSPEFKCAFDDEIAAVLRRLPKADVAVFATPTYFFGPTAQLKLLLDRMYCLFKFDEHGMKSAIPATSAIGLISTAGGDAQSGIQARRADVQGHGRLHQPSASHAAGAQRALDPSELAKDESLRKKAQEFGGLLARQ